MTQPPYGQDPQSQPPQPYGQNPYAQSPYGQPGPYGPPPPARKSRTALIAGVVLVVLLIAGGGLAALLLLSDSDKGDDNGKADDRTSTSTSAPSADQIHGNGYSYTLPDGWQDATDQAQGAPGAIDTVSVWGEKLEGGRANFIVESGSSGGEDDPEAIRDQWVSNMTGSTGAEPHEIPGATIDGEETIGVQFERTNERDVEIVQTAYLAVHDGNVYSIAISAKIGDDDAEQAFEDILDSWTWE
jgi:hypothetical protein